MNKKPKINALVIISLIINFLISLSISVNPDLGSTAKPFMVIMLGFWALGIIGLIMVITTGKKAGATLITISCVIFFPIGLVGVSGAKKILEEINRIEAGL